MKIKSLIATVIETIIKIVILAVAIIFIYKGITLAYDFGYKVFADEPVSAGEGRTITVGVSDGSDVENVAKMLEEKGLIKDANLFVVQELLSEYHGKIQTGIYDLSTDMTAAEMLKIMSEDYVESSEDAIVDLNSNEDNSGPTDEFYDEGAIEDEVYEGALPEDEITEGGDEG